MFFSPKWAAFRRAEKDLYIEKLLCLQYVIHDYYAMHHGIAWVSVAVVFFVFYDPVVQLRNTIKEYKTWNF